MSTTNVKENLTRLFRPKSMAIVGASNTPGKRGHLLISQLHTQEYEGEIYPINPNYTEILGHKCYADLAALPERPEVVSVCLGASSVPDVVEECGRLGIRSLAVVAAGFADAGLEGVKIQLKMLEAAERHGISIMGPNGIGILNRIDRVQYWMSAPRVPAYRDRTPSGVSAVLQSGALGLTITNDGLERGLSLDYVVSAGNQASIDISDYIDWMLDDTRTNTRVIAAVLEGIWRPQEFRAVARKALARGTAIIVLKSGKSARTRDLIASHTGAMVGSSAIAQQVFAQDGVIAVDDMDELVEQMVLQAHARRPAGNRWFMLSPSGGGNAVISDLAEELDVPVSPAPAKITSVMKQVGDRAVQNPFDAAGYLDAPGAAEKAILAAADDPDIDVVIGMFTMYPIATRGHVNYMKAYIEAAAATSKPVLVFNFTGGPVSEFSRDLLCSAGIYPLKGSRSTLLALKRWLWWNEMQRGATRSTKVDTAPLVLPSSIGASLEEKGAGNLGPDIAQATLNAAGLRLAPAQTAPSARDAVAFADAHGYPVVIKVEHAELIHKTEAGAVAIGLQDKASVEAAFERMTETVIPATGLKNARVIVQKQLEGGVEMLLAARRDSVFGPYVVVGLGGIHTELFKDYALRPAPVDLAGAQAMLRQLKGWPLLDGFRRGQVFDHLAAADSIVRLSQLAVALGLRLDTIEMNPVIVMPASKGVWVVDVVMALA